MEESALIEKLLLFGLGRQEAIVYLCLIKKGELTGYEVAKHTGISRSNVYNSLASLVDHGAAYMMEGASTKYTAVSMGEFCDNRIRHLKEVEEYLLKNCPRPTKETEGYITIEGNVHICDKIRHILSETKQRVYFSAASEFLENWQEEIVRLLKRKIKVVLISGKVPEALKKSVEEEKVIFYQNDMVDERRQIRLIIDSSYVLTGEMEYGATGTCLYSAQKNFVEVFKEAMHNEIRLIELGAKLS